MVFKFNNFDMLPLISFCAMAKSDANNGQFFQLPTEFDPYLSIFTAPKGFGNGRLADFL
jgi:hypothetical protein